ncbi:MAG: PepSY domain-containing protein, partial [Acidobacteriia bacterium]|nr:PepSY domain-containing protein [Terriglobia bacterium]
VGLTVIPDSAPSMIIFPAKNGDAFTLRLRRPSDPHRIGLNWVYIEPSTAKVLRVDRFDQQPRDVQIIRLLTPLHYGTIGGYATRILWVITGLMPGLFFVTALLMWWNRTLSKKWRRARRSIPAFAAEPTAVAR